HNVRVLPVNDAVENCGLRKIGLRRSHADSGVWEIYVSARNYGTVPRQVTLALGFGGAPAGSRHLSLPPGTERETTFNYRTRAAGPLEVRLFPGDAFPEDDRAILELPALETLQVTVYSDAPDLLHPFLDANARVSAAFHPTAAYKSDDKGLVILDRFRPRTRPLSDSIWIDPPAGDSPIPVKQRI